MSVTWVRHCLDKAGIMEKNMETTMLYRGYIGMILHPKLGQLAGAFWAQHEPDREWEPRRNEDQGQPAFWGLV